MHVRQNPGQDRQRELVEAQALTGPELARVVTSGGGTAPVVTDGPFVEFKELLAEPIGRRRVGGTGHRDRREDLVRAGPGRCPAAAADRRTAGDGRIRLRPADPGAVTDAPPVEDLLRALAPQVLSAARSPG